MSDPNRDVRVGSFIWFRPSVVFYARREVAKLLSPQQAAEFLAVPTPGYLFVTEPVWKEWVAGHVTVPVHIVARHFDFYGNCEVLVIANGPGRELASR